MPDTVFEGFYGGAAGGGKSEVLMMLPIARQFLQHPRFKGLILRRTYPELEREMILRSHMYYPAAGGTYNEEKKRWKFPSGAIIQFGYAEHKEDVRHYDTDEYSYIAFDELTSFMQSQYIYLAISRCRTPDSTRLPAIVRSASNPGNIGHAFVRSRFVEPNSAGYHIIVDKYTGLKRIFIPARVDDNPHIDPGYASRLRGLPEAEMRAKLLGDWWTFEGQVFDDWREEPFPGEPDNARHVIRGHAGAVPAWWPKIIAGDWGFTAMTWFGFGAITPDSRLVVFREYACKNTKISTWATDIGRIARELDNLKLVVLDPSAWHNRGDEKTVAEQFEQYSGLRPLRADNDRIGGKILLQEYLRWLAKPALRFAQENFNNDLALEILRKFGTVEYGKYLAQFEPEKPETNLPKLQVSEQCTELRKCIPLCIYDDKNKEDVKEFDGDDPYDGIRYLIKAADYYLASSTAEAVRREKIAAACSQLETNGDQTAFYRRMEKLERTAREVHAVKRFQRVA